MKKLTVAFTIATTLFTSSVFAANSDILNTFGKLNFDKKDIKITESPVTGFKTVTTPEGVFYVSNDGKFLTQGPIYNMQGARPENIANSSNLKLIKPIDKDAIVFQAKNPKFTIYVFSDYTCSYCKKLHEEIDTYLDKGISVHYFAFPRAGLNSEVATNMQSIWSAKDRKKAFDNAYKGNPIPSATSVVPYVSTQFNVGRQLGISGTPAIILPNGQLLAGYVPANELIKILEQNK